jgi:Zinc knuckle
MPRGTLPARLPHETQSEHLQRIALEASEIEGAVQEEAALDSANEDFPDQTSSNPSIDAAGHAFPRVESPRPADIGMSETMEAQLAQIMTELQNLKSENARLREEIRGNAPESPSQSTRESGAFDVSHGCAFARRGMAGRSIFKPLPSGPDQNPLYRDKAKERGIAPEKFTGVPGSTFIFEMWCRQLENELKEDVRCFRTEQSRMNYASACLTGEALASVAPRLTSSNHEFDSLAELIQVLETACGDPQAASKARQELSDLTYQLGADFNRFLGKFNALYEKANLPRSDLKQVLWEHVPPKLGPHLMVASRDQNVGYETFCNMVSDSAFNMKREMEWEKRKTPTRTGGAGRHSHSYSSSVFNPHLGGSFTSVATKKLSKLSSDERQKLRDMGGCFKCRKIGHLAKDCPEIPTKSQQVAAINREESETSSTSSENEWAGEKTPLQPR